MSANSNPEIVIDSVIDNDSIKTDNGIKLHPLTIRRYCFLEKIKSPFIFKDKVFDVENIIPTAYILSCDNMKLKQYTTKDIQKLIDDSMDWSDSLNVNDIPKLIEEISKQINMLNESAPETVQSSSETNDGSKKK